MKKVVAVLDPAELDAVKLHLTDAGVEGRLGFETIVNKTTN
jgi:hypothetical protein